MKKRTLYQLITRNRSRIAKSEKAGCIDCRKIFPASEALKADGWLKKLFDPEELEELAAEFKTPDKDTLYCPNCDGDHCVVGDADLPDFDSFKRVVENAQNESDVVAIEYATIDIEHPEKYKGKLYIARTRGVGLPDDSYRYVLLTEQEPRTEHVILNKDGSVIPSKFPSDVEGDVLTSETIEVTSAFSCEVEGEKRELTSCPSKDCYNHREVKEEAERLYSVKSTNWIPLNPKFPDPIFPPEDEETDTDQPHLNLDQDPDDWLPDEDL